MNNPYSHYPQKYPDQQYSEQNRSVGRNRNERWGSDDYRGQRASWRDDSMRAPNRSAWGEQGGYQQSRYAPNFSGSNFPGQSGDYDQNYQGGNFDEYGYSGNDWQSQRSAPWRDEENYSGQQDYQRGGTIPSRDLNRGENPRWNQDRDWQQSWQGRSQAYGDSGQFGYRQPSWRGGGQSAHTHNYGSDYGASDYSLGGSSGDFQGGQSYQTGAYGLRQQTSHQGRGPKGYTRTDERIREDICECLSHDSRIDASEVTVEVREGVVTLEGSVQDRGQKHRIEDIADNCSGVKDVHNGLRVTRQAANTSGSSSGTTSETTKNRESSSGKNH